VGVNPVPMVLGRTVMSGLKPVQSCFSSGQMASPLRRSGCTVRLSRVGIGAGVGAGAAARLQWSAMLGHEWGE